MMSSLINLIAGDNEIIPYRKELNKITGGVMASILLSQMLYWYSKVGNSFYKFKAPCENKLYKKGDSWCEELGFSIRELDSALKKLKEAKLIEWKTDISRLTYWTINIELLKTKLENAFTQTTKEHLYKSQNDFYINAENAFTQTTKEHLDIRNNFLTETTQEITSENTQEREGLSPHAHESPKDEKMDLLYRQKLIAGDIDYEPSVKNTQVPKSPPVSAKNAQAKQATPRPQGTKFQKPSLEELKAYAKEVNLAIDCEHLFDYYESVGWRIGNRAMKDWRATMRNWARREVSFNGAKPPNGASSALASTMSEEEMMNLAGIGRPNPFEVKLPDSGYDWRDDYDKKRFSNRRI